jgi:hypothetical protein
MIKIAGIVLIVLGILALAYQSLSYKETKEDAQIGSLTIQHKETETIPLPPIVGAVFIVAGAAALFINGRKA